MRITKRQIRRIIKEEHQRILHEKFPGPGEESSGSGLIHFAKAYAALGPQVQEQIEAIIEAHVGRELPLDSEEFIDVAMQQNPAAIDAGVKGLYNTNLHGVDANDELIRMGEALEAAQELHQGDE
jgi:hypothetical protein